MITRDRETLLILSAIFLVMAFVCFFSWFPGLRHVIGDFVWSGIEFVINGEYSRYERVVW